MYVASLPMYDLPALATHTNAWWQGLTRAMKAEGICDLSGQLNRSAEDEIFWRRPELILSQTCGYPLMTGYREDLTLLATPHYNVPGCEGLLYCSWIIVPVDHPATSLADLRGDVCAINGWASQSGMNALRHAVAQVAGSEAFFSKVLVSGGHRNSVQMVASGAVQVAAVDCVTWALLEATTPSELEGVRILGPTAPAPVLPYVTAGGASPERVESLQRALDRAVADPDLAEALQALKISGFSRTSLADYQIILDMEVEAENLGYGILK